MAQRLKPLSRPQREVIDALAHLYVASDLDKNVAGMEGFARSWRDSSLTPKQRQILTCFEQRIPEIYRDMVRMLEEES